MTDEVTILEANYLDGRFTQEPFDNRPPWVDIALKSGFMAVVPLPEETFGKYKAAFAVKKNDGTIQIAEVGDKITHDMMFGLIVQKQRRNKLKWDDVRPKAKRGRKKADAETK